MDAFTAVSSSLDLGPSARSRRVAALAAAALRSDAMFPPRYSRTSSLSDMPVFSNALTAAESTSIFGMVIAAVSASWDGPFVDVVAVAPRSIFILAGKPASWAVDSAGGFSGPAELARGESGRTSGVCLKARRSHVCRSVRVRSMRVRRGSRTRSLAGPRAMGPVRVDASSSPFFLGRLSGCGERFTTNEELGSANRIGLCCFSHVFSHEHDSQVLFQSRVLNQIPNPNAKISHLGCQTTLVADESFALETGCHRGNESRAKF